MQRPHAQLLFVDDDPSAIHAMRMLLSDYPNPRFATCGSEALRLARELHPDLIVLDANMPRMSGLEVLAALQADDALRDIPVMVATAQNDSAMELAALQQGAVDFVSKPLAPLQFRARVQAHLQTHPRLRRGAQAPQERVDRAVLPCPGLPNLLVVDDDITAIHLLRKVLTDTGTVYFATTGADALHLARRVRPDLILLDAHMPGLDGFQVCAKLKSDPMLSAIPVVFVSRYDDALHETRALDTGAADFISKPFSPAVLKARVRNLLNLKQRSDAEAEATRLQWRELADARVADIVNHASDAILTCNEQRRVLLANAAASQLFGLPLQRIVGHALDELIPEPAEWVGLERQARLETRIRRSDGQDIPVEVSASHLNDLSTRLTTWVLRDLSQREQLAQAARAQADAEADSAAKTRMMAWIAHEMGNPLNAVRGFIQLLRLNLPPSHLADRSAGYLDHLEAGSLQLQQLLGDLLTMAQGDSDCLEVKVQALDTRTVLSAALSTVEAQATEANIIVHRPTLATGVWVLADERRLHQCLVNLLSNAIKYNRALGHVSVSLRADLEQVHLDISDNGQGMTEAQLQQLFQPFNRLGRQHQRTSGSGLGLVITRQLVNAMGGSLQVRSSADQGSCFTITLPCASTTVAAVKVSA